MAGLSWAQAEQISSLSRSGFVPAQVASFTIVLCGQLTKGFVRSLPNNACVNFEFKERFYAHSNTSPAFRYSQMTPACAANLTNDAISGINDFQIPQMSTEAFVALSNFSALGDTFGSANMDQLTSMAHFTDGTASGMYIALQMPTGATLASRLSANSLWYWTGDFNVTAKITALKGQIMGHPFAWNAFNDRIKVSTWNWIHMASVTTPPSSLWLDQLVATEGLNPSALAGFQPSGGTSYDVQNLTLDCFQYFTPETAAVFPAATLNVRDCPSFASVSDLFLSPLLRNYRR